MTPRPTSLRRSIRTRIAASFAFAAILPTLLLALVVDHVSMQSGLSQLRSRATTELTAAIATSLFTDQLLPGATLSPESAPDPLVESVQADRRATYFDGRTMWAASPVPEGFVTVRVSARPLLDQRLSLRRTMVGAGALLTLLMTGLGWLLADGLTSRLRRAAREIETAGRHEVSARGAPDLLHVAPHDPGDEVSELVDRINDLTLDLRRRLEVERGFSATVAHELRTPLTALVSATELLPAGPATDRVRRQTQRLRRLAEELIDLARAELADQQGGESLDLADLLTDLASRFPDVEVTSEAPGTTRADRRAVDQILSNLVRNAEQHGARPVAIAAHGLRIEVTDSGPGFPADLARHGPTRFAPYGVTGGTGLGLALAASWAQAIGAELTLSNRTHDGAVTGARAVLLLPSDPARPEEPRSLG